jgi:hypothetical protein
VSGILEVLNQNVLKADWWVDQVASFVIFGWIIGLIAGWVASRLQARRQRLERAPYEGWKLMVKGFGDPPEDLYWADVQRCRESEFELWKWVKSICSGACLVTARSAKMAKQQGWLRIDIPAKLITIDFTVMTKEHAHGWKGQQPWRSSPESAPDRLGETAPTHGPR